MNPVKVGLIGFGRMGGFYLDEMQKSGRWDVAYICDVCAESRDLARKLAPGAKVVDDEQVIFDDPEVQVVGLFALADSRKSQIERAFAAGKHVIAEKPISDSIENEWQAVELAENEKLGTAKGMGGDVTVKVTMDGDKIAAVEVVSQNETAGISDPALEKVPAAIVEANSADVDGVAGATVTSDAIKNAVKDALSK